jgi:plastocyanin
LLKVKLFVGDSVQFIIKHDIKMKKLFTLLLVILTFTLQLSATKHTVTTSGSAYSPAILTVHVGDTVSISASVVHPLLQVSKTTWQSNGVTPLPNGFGLQTKVVTFKVTSTDTIYYICEAHVEFGMKGRVIVAPSSGINESPVDTESVTIYPNPVTSTGTVKISSFGTNPVSVYLYGINGQLEKDLSRDLTMVNGDLYVKFDIQNLASGNHFIMVADGKNRIAQKFAVIR